MAEMASNNDLNPIDPHILLVVAVFCLTAAVTLPADRLHNLIDLLNLALQIYGRR